MVACNVLQVTSTHTDVSCHVGMSVRFAHEYIVPGSVVLAYSATSPTALTAPTLPAVNLCPYALFQELCSIHCLTRCLPGAPIPPAVTLKLQPPCLSGLPCSISTHGAAHIMLTLFLLPPYAASLSQGIPPHASSHHLGLPLLHNASPRSVFFFSVKAPVITLTSPHANHPHLSALLVFTCCTALWRRCSTRWQ